MSSKHRPEGEAGRFTGESQHGWSPDLGSDGDAAAEAGEKARQKPSHDTGEGRTISKEEREGMEPTDMEPESASGESRRRRGEDIAADSGKEPEGHKGPSRRPYGTAG
jgi:hypothetical protein